MRLVLSSGNAKGRGREYFSQKCGSFVTNRINERGGTRKVAKEISIPLPITESTAITVLLRYSRGFMLYTGQGSVTQESRYSLKDHAINYARVLMELDIKPESELVVEASKVFGKVWEFPTERPFIYARDRVSVEKGKDTRKKTMTRKKLGLTGKLQTT